MGEQVKAVVQPVDMSEAGPALEAELIAYCREKLAHYKCPRSIDFDPALPRQDTDDGDVGRLDDEGYRTLARDSLAEAGVSKEAIARLCDTQVHPSLRLRPASPSPSTVLAKTRGGRDR